MDINSLWRSYNRLLFKVGGGRNRFISGYYKGFDKKSLTKEQLEQIQDYWIPLYGKNVRPDWHQLLYSLSGFFTPSYMPLEVYSDLITYWVPSYKVMAFFDDKNLYRYLFNGFRMPKRVVECCNGVFYLPQLSDVEVPIQDVLEYCHNLTNCIIKPSKESSAGIGVKSFDVIEGLMKDGRGVKECFQSYHQNFVIEQKIQENNNLHQLNPSSCNSLRIHTWRNESSQKVEYVSSYVRIGREGKIIDNASSGGITCQVLSDGVLANNACTVSHYSIVNETDSGIKLSGYTIDRFRDMVDTAIRAHSRIPYFGLIGWDICVDSEDEPMIIEYNPNPDLRIEQLVFKDSCLIDKNIEILHQVFKNGKKKR